MAVLEGCRTRPARRSCMDEVTTIDDTDVNEQQWRTAPDLILDRHALHGVTFELEPRDGCLDEFANMAMHVRDSSPEEASRFRDNVGLQVISLNPLVWVHRFTTCDAVGRGYSWFIDMLMHKSNESWEITKKRNSNMRQIARVRRVAVLGPLSGYTRSVLQQVCATWGGSSTPLGSICTPLQPAWLTELMHTGEIVACHSLAANHAAAENVVEGASIVYQVRDYPSKGSGLHTVAGPFEYEVLATFGAAHGRAIVVRPKHDASSIYVCFRGVRRTYDEVGREDRQAMMHDTMVAAQWMRPLVCDGKSVARSALRVHRGIHDYHRSVYESMGNTAGLRDWLDMHIARSMASATGSASGPNGAIAPPPPPRVVFIGFSLGGALAQVSALRAALDFPRLASHIGVLAFGATQWASAEAAVAFRATFGARAAHMATASTEAEISLRAPLMGKGRDGAPLLWRLEGLKEDQINENPRRTVAVAAGGLLGGGQCMHIDPLAFSQSGKTQAVHNMYLLEASRTRLPVEAAAPLLLHFSDGERMGTTNHSDALPMGTVPQAETTHSLMKAAMPTEESTHTTSGNSVPRVSPTLTRTSSFDDALDGTPSVHRAPLPTFRTPGALTPHASVLHCPPTACVERAALHRVLKRKHASIAALVAHTKAAAQYWRGEAPEDVDTSLEASVARAFADATKVLHRGEAYRSALLREHWRLRAFAEHLGGELPVAMRVEQAWALRAEPVSLNQELPRPSQVHEGRHIPRLLAEHVMKVEGPGATAGEELALERISLHNERCTAPTDEVPSYAGFSDDEELAALGF